VTSPTRRPEEDALTTTAVENLPAIWDDARDIPFLRITARLFTPRNTIRTAPGQRR
jgi:hypothetical protein